MTEPEYKSTLPLGAHSGTGGRVVYSLGDNYFLLARLLEDVPFGDKLHVRGALYEVQGELLVEIEAEKTLFTAPVGYRLNGLFSAQVPFYTYSPIPGGMVATLRMTNTSDGRRQLEALLFTVSGGMVSVATQTLYSETLMGSQRIMDDWAGANASWAGTFVSMATVAGGVICVLSMVQTDSGFQDLYGIGARKIAVTGAGFGAPTNWEQVLGWWDEDTDQFVDPITACPSGTGIVVYAETHDPAFNAENSRLLWIDDDLTLGLNLEFPFLGESNDSRLWPRQGGGLALTAFTNFGFIHYALTFTGSGATIAFEEQVPINVENFQWSFTGPCRLLNGNLYANFWFDGVETRVMTVDYDNPITQPAIFPVPAMASDYDFWDVSEDGVSVVVWGRAGGQHELSLLQVAAVEPEPEPEPPAVEVLGPPQGCKLGCAEEYRVIVTSRCGATTVCELGNISDLTYGRVMDDTSEAIIIMDLASGDQESTCCECLGNVRSWIHSVMIFRDGDLVWGPGPVVNVLYRRDQVSVTARDVTAWLDVRHVHNYLDFVDADPLVIASALIDDAMAPDDPCGIADGVFVQAPAVPGFIDREYLEIDPTGYVGDAFRELARTNMDYTVIGSTIIIGEPLAFGPYTTLTDEDFLVDIEVEERGLEAATEWTVQSEFASGSAGGIDPFYGLIEQLVEESELEDDDHAILIATNRLVASNPVPMYVNVPEGARLSPDAPVCFELLVPGTLVNVNIRGLCRQVYSQLKLTALTVHVTSGDEEVGITLSPLGTSFGEAAPL